MAEKLSLPLEEEQFLIELRELTMKHGIAIGGCGCCSSPWLEKVDVSDNRAGYSCDDKLQWIAPSDEYWENDSGNIIK